MKKERYPLTWPDGKARTPSYSRIHSPFQRPLYQRSRSEGAAVVRNTSRWHSMSEAVDLIEGNVHMMGGGAMIISTNVKLRMDGLPYSGQAQPADSGAAVYFEFKKRPIAFACDKFLRVECNLYSIGKTIEATRAVERWGAATLTQSFRGFMAIPEKTGGDDPYALLSLKPGCTEDELKAAYREAAKKFHPDVPVTGSYSKWQQICDAYNLVAQNVRQAA